MAEHDNMQSIAFAATSVVLAHAGQHTKRILSGNRTWPKRRPEMTNMLAGLDADALARGLADDRLPAYPGVEDLAQLIAAA